MTDRYVAAHQSPEGPGDSRPTARQIILDEGLENRWPEKTILITGCSAGIGKETAKALYSTGATLYLTARNLAKARVALGDIAHSNRVHLLQLNLGSLASVRSCAEYFLSKNEKLHILICNAGMMDPMPGKTHDGFEVHFGTNHLSHFLLFNLLKPALQSAASPDFASRVIIVSSVAHRFFNFNLEDVEKETFNGMIAYGGSKLCNSWTANEIERRFGQDGIHAWSVHPGSVSTELARNLPEDERNVQQTNPIMRKITKTSEQGASTVVWGATASALEGKGGGYLEDAQISEEWDPAAGQFSNGYSSQCLDASKAEEMWRRSLHWVGLESS
ncbi:hypothetical protein CkaCkLH20_11268 [Colletotrichum karsti]|uniref:Oxidoreductase n=1 Tax=Colletotrichum karsti TaxID=1095194 RepID=A0A9P6HUK9_9PEZI|nr:uncharacterized protein CkaCkLH20_11268 [Colletotrichum karsti]KAF9871347.1 hypothetical protein CkaCkLH20_11268 [Colletotrichum karsti]